MYKMYANINNDSSFKVRISNDVIVTLPLKINVFHYSPP